MWFLYLLLWFVAALSPAFGSAYCYTDGSLFKTLDGARFNFSISQMPKRGCKFLLLGSCSPGSIPYFRLLIGTDKNNRPQKVSLISHLYLEGRRIQFEGAMYSSTDTFIKGVNQDPANYSLSYNDTTQRTVVRFAKDMIKLEYRSSSLSVFVNQNLLATGLCGLCGNYDEIRHNDLMLKNGSKGSVHQVGWSYEDPGIKGEYCTKSGEECQREAECAALDDINVFGHCARFLHLRRLCEEKFCRVPNVDRFDVFRELINDCRVFGLPVPGTWLYKTALHCRDQCVNSSNHGKQRLMKTPVGTNGSTELNCYTTGEPYGTSFCNADVIKGPYWGDVTWQPACPPVVESNQTKELEVLSVQDVSVDTYENVSLALESLTESTRHLTNKDIVLISMILQNIAEVSKVSFEAVQSIIRVMNNMIKSPKQTLAAAQNKNRALNRAVTSLEGITNKMSLKDSQRVCFSQPTISVESRILKDLSSDINFKIGNMRGVFSNCSKTNRSSLSDSTSTTSIKIPSASLQQIFNNTRVTDDQKLVFVFYQDVSLFTASESSDTKSTVQNDKLASYVIAASVAGVPVEKLATPIQITFELAQDTDNYACVYWNFTLKDNYGGWSQSGCYSSGRQGSHVICLCHHMTHFAILIDIRPDLSPPGALQILSKIGLALSTFGLCVTIASFILFRRFRKGRGFRILFQLCMSLLAVNVLVLAGIERTDLPEVCMSLAALLLYFLLAAFCWMMVEAVHQYLLFVKVYGSDITAFMRKAALFAWGVPAVILSVVAAVDFNMFRGPESFCWINKTALFYAFMLPVGAIILINTVLFSLVVHGIFCARIKHEYRGKAGSHGNKTLQLMIAVACFIVIGMTWVFGFFAVGDARVTFQYLFCIFNSMQGFFIFLFYVVREKRLRHAWITCLCCRKDSNDIKRHQFIMTSSSTAKPSSG